MTFWAMSFALWRCKGCRMEVEWEDARALTDESGKCIGFVHVDCEAPDD